MVRGRLHTIRYLAGTFGFWLLYFGLARLLFLAYHLAHFPKPGSPDIWRILGNGAYMDASMAGYCALLAYLLWLASPWLPVRLTQNLFLLQGGVLATLFSVLVVADLEIYAQWGHRIDAAILPYLAHPKEAMASSASSPWILLALMGMALTAAAIQVWKTMAKNLSPKPLPFHGLLALPALALLVVPIRGGFQLSPINQSSVYFSTVREWNQAAENPVWVFFQSVLESRSGEMDHVYCTGPSTDAAALVSRLYPPADSTTRHLASDRPHVVIIVWESLTAKVVGHLAGKFPSTPTLDSLGKTGLWFSDFFASGDRSDKGLAALLASVPALGKLNIMAQPNLGDRLDFLPRYFSGKGYETAFLYGGELEFANIKSFMLQAGFHQLIGKQDFPREMWNSKWGAHDEQVFAKQLEVARASRQPFFHVLFTLSSHEPFEVPGETPLPGLPTDSLFCRAHRYTDRCLRNWLKEAGKTDWWKNTLVVVVADHGHTAPGKSRESDAKKYRIPMVWFGPALRSKGRVDRMGSQTDLAFTLRRQCGDTASRMLFSADLFAGKAVPHAGYAFRNGFVLLEEGGKSSRVIDPSTVQNRAQQFRQAAYERFYRISTKP